MADKSQAGLDNVSVRVRFVTREEGLKVDDAPIQVPVELKRYGLSEIVNQLLDLPEPVPFSFLANGETVKGSLQKHLEQNAISTENILELEYIRSSLPPTFLSSFNQEDWISSIKLHSASGRTTKIATGSYDGIVRLWNLSGTVETELAGHSGAVKSVRWIDSHKLVSAGFDRKLCLWSTAQKDETDDADTAKGSLRCVLSGHKSVVNDVEVLPTGKLVSGDADGRLLVWSSKPKELPDVAKESESQFSSSSKRRRVAEKANAGYRVKGNLTELRGHQNAVTGIVKHHTDPEVFYSVSEDHTLRTWDLASCSLVDTKTTQSPILSVATIGQGSGLIACGMSTRQILLMDPRATLRTSQSELKGHKNFVVSLAPSPRDDYHLASASHDGTVRVWDIRANRSLYTITEKDSNDLLAVDWQDYLVFGGKSKKLTIHQTSS